MYDKEAVEIYIKDAFHTFFKEFDLGGYVPQQGSTLTFEDKHIETVVQKVDLHVFRELLSIEVQPLGKLSPETVEYLMEKGWCKHK